MTNVQRCLIMFSGIAFITACQESPTAPPEIMSSPSAPRMVITPDPTLVTFNSASCTLVNSATGSVHCSWDISNPSANTVNLAVQVSLQASYDCVHPQNGRIATSEVRDLGTLYQQSGVSSTSLTGTDVALSLPYLPTDYRGSMKKLNACKGNAIVENLTWSMTYWEVTVSTIGGTLRQSCFALDNRNGCYTS